MKHEEIYRLAHTQEDPETGCWNWKRARTKGYAIARLDGGRSPNRVARFVYQVLHGKLPTTVVVRHTCDNPACVNPLHLIRGTQKENIADSIERGRWKGGTSGGACRGGGARNDNFVGSNSPNAKLSEDDVMVIKKWCASGVLKVRAIAEVYEVTAATIYRIVRGDGWAHVKE